MVNFSDLELDSYHPRNFRASSRKETFPGWVLALPPRPQMTSSGQGGSAVRCSIVGDDDDDADRGSSREMADERQGTGEEGPEGGDGRDRTASADTTMLADGDDLDEETGETGAKYPVSSWCSAGISLFDGSLRPPNMLL